MIEKKLPIEILFQLVLYEGISDVRSVKFKESSMVAIENESVIKFIPVLSKDIKKRIMNNVGNGTADQIMEFVVGLYSTWVGEVHGIGVGNFLSALVDKLMFVFLEVDAVDQPE